MKSVASLMVTVGVLVAGVANGHAQTPAEIQYRVLATNRTGTMERELNQAAEQGFRFEAVMGGETVGGSEVVAVVSKTPGSNSRVAYKLLATSRTSTMERELQAAADQGFVYRGQTVFSTAFGGEEVVCILERDEDVPVAPTQYRLLATARTSTLQNELREAGVEGFEIVGMTVGSTAVGGTELVAIMRRARPQ